jgi:hypothetical protein
VARFEVSWGRLGTTREQAAQQHQAGGIRLTSGGWSSWASIETPRQWWADGRVLIGHTSKRGCAEWAQQGATAADRLADASSVAVRHADVPCRSTLRSTCSLILVMVSVCL